MRRNPSQKANRRLALVGAGVAGLLILGACAGGDDEGSVTLASAPSTTIEPATTTPSTTPAAATPTTVARTATTLPAPVYVGGVPQVKPSPAQAWVGTRVRIEGTGFTDENWRQVGAPLYLSATASAPCNLVATVEHTVKVTAAGHLTGEFTVPAMGVCRQSSIGEIPLVTGTYKIAYQCTACHVGEIEITVPPAPVSLRCANVGFTPNSDNLASDIVATGLSCAEAEALVRKVGPPLGPINGLPRAEADGFVCVRTSQSEGRGLPISRYECTSGSKTITFVRT